MFFFTLGGCSFHFSIFMFGYYAAALLVLRSFFCLPPCLPACLYIYLYISRLFTCLSISFHVSPLSACSFPYLFMSVLPALSFFLQSVYVSAALNIFFWVTGKFYSRIFQGKKCNGCNNTFVVFCPLELNTLPIKAEDKKSLVSFLEEDVKLWKQYWTTISMIVTRIRKRWPQTQLWQCIATTMTERYLLSFSL